MIPLDILTSCTAPKRFANDFIEQGAINLRINVIRKTNNASTESKAKFKVTAKTIRSPEPASLAIRNRVQGMIHLFCHHTSQLMSG